MSDKTSYLAHPNQGNRIGLARYISESLEQAKDSRSYVFVDCLVNDRVVFQLKGAIQQVESNRFSVYLHDQLDYLPIDGMRAHLYFSLRIDHKMLPYDFTTTLLETQRVNREALLYFAMPEDISHHQRRYNVRVPVTKDDIGNFRVWYGRSDFNVGDAQKLQWLPFEIGQTDLIDISAGGIQLSVDKKSELVPFLSAKEILLTNGVFEIKGKENVALMLAGQIIRISDEKRAPNLQVGISFRQWAKINPDILRWVSTNPEDGVVPLASWVFQVIMERYKKDKTL